MNFSPALQPQKHHKLGQGPLSSTCTCAHRTPPTLSRAFPTNLRGMPPLFRRTRVPPLAVQAAPGNEAATVGSPQKCCRLQKLPPAAPAPPSGPSPPWVRQLSDDRASCHQQLPLCQPPKPLPVPLQIKAGKDGEASTGANCQRREGRKRSNSVGHRLLGCEDKSRHKYCPKQGGGRAPATLLWVLPLKKCAH